ncbi:MAG: hypothetical protein A2007_02340 [Verrucomicrobia bacterium GWC2_42_7]|nr:MAG: hypothetical protein A2007_02340 [Verrucomicrobia bacterium GWC2_42_7]
MFSPSPFPKRSHLSKNKTYRFYFCARVRFEENQRTTYRAIKIVKWMPLASYFYHKNKKRYFSERGQKNASSIFREGGQGECEGAYVDM